METISRQKGPLYLELVPALGNGTPFHLARPRYPAPTARQRQRDGKSGRQLCAGALL
ncbi:hypothetical protein PCI56_08355 [Plesiomonas shigelloides subsp. oncorhynchi]|nr:hypothetical protein [Plesiomonas shigelloides]